MKVYPVFLAGVLFGNCVLDARTHAGAQDKPIELRASHWTPTSHPLHKAMQDWGASVEKASNGSIKFNLYPAQQLGKAFDHYDMARDGVADMTFVNPGYQPGRFPIISAAELPFMMSNAKGGSAALDAWYRKYADQEMKDVKFCIGYAHDPGSFHSRTKKIVVPSDIAGMKIRPAHATMAAFITQSGGTNIQAAAPEIRDVMEKGVADAATFGWGSVVLFGIDRVTKYHLEVPLYTTALIWVLNRKKYESMSPAQKKVIDDHCNNEWALRVATPWANFEHEGIAKLKAAANHEVYPITAEQLAEWKQAAAPLRATWAHAVRKTGADPEAVMKEFSAELAKHQAAY